MNSTTIQSKKGFQMTDEEYYCSLTALIGDRKVEYAVVDPSAASFIECIKKARQKYAWCVPTTTL